MDHRHYISEHALGLEVRNYFYSTSACPLSIKLEVIVPLPFQQSTQH